MNNLLTIAVLMGGPSSEHEVSLKSGAMVLAALDKEKYRAVPIVISKDSLWKFPDDAELSAGLALERLKKENVAAVFIAMHGEFGEDGTLQGFLEVAGLPYTCSGVLASALAMDKPRSADLVQMNGVLVPSTRALHRDAWETSQATLLQLAAMLKPPYVVKPANLGSSVGVSIVENADGLGTAIAKAFSLSPTVLVQECIVGMEVTCGVLDTDSGSRPVALPPTEIIPKGGTFFDYEAKYKKGGSDEVTPARLPEEIIKKIQSVALIAHTVLGCSGMSRTDMIVRGSDVYYLETNTIPGMTETSLVPQAARVAGIEFPELVHRLIQAALKKN